MPGVESLPPSFEGAPLSVVAPLSVGAAPLLELEQAAVIVAVIKSTDAHAENRRMEMAPFDRARRRGCWRADPRDRYDCVVWKIDG
jgi:hypothetical protein